MAFRFALLLAIVLVGGCTAPILDGAVDDTRAGGAALIGLPTVLTSKDGPGFEPSIEVGPDGTVYVAAAKTARPNEGTRLADWVWYSPDGGTTWRDLPSTADAHRAMPGLEGDLAVDGEGRVYYADTWGPDLSLSRWSPGPTWDWSRPLLGTMGALDDRPFLAAHGDGHVYLLSNTAMAGARIQLSRSTDAGLTWAPTAPFPESRFCHVAASPADEKTVAVACANGEGRGVPLVVRVSTDGAQAWKDFVVPAAYQRGTGYLSPSVAIDGAGAIYAVWADDRVDWSGVQDASWAGDEPGRIVVAIQEGETWRAMDVTPFAGRFGMLHACAGSGGTLGMSFYATRDATVTEGSEWHAYGLIVADSSSEAPAWTHDALLPDPVATGAMPPRDIQECAFAPDDAMHVAFQRDRIEPGEPGDGIRADILHATMRRR